MTKFLTHTRMIITSLHGENYKTGVLASPHLTYLIQLHTGQKIKKRLLFQSLFQ